MNHGCVLFPIPENFYTYICVFVHNIMVNLLSNFCRRRLYSPGYCVGNSKLTFPTNSKSTSIKVERVNHLSFVHLKYT